MSQLSPKNILTRLQIHCDELLPLQRLDADRPDYGGVVNPQWDIVDPKITERFILACTYLELGNGQLAADLGERVLLAAEYLLRAQRPSGLIDLLSVNYDSSPDTGFTVQALCALIESARRQQVNSPQWTNLFAKLEKFIRRAVAGMLTGGFHTPNHRWVIVSALVQAKALFPDLDVAATVEAYLAEGFDIDAEGTFIERSVGVYDAVNTRSLLLIAENWDAPTALEAVQRNLTFNLHLLHADGTAETGLSHRQDYGTRAVPIELAHCYLLCHHASPNPVFVKAAHTLWEQHPDPGVHLLWLCYALLKYGDPEPVATALPANFSVHYPLNGVWRVRRDRLSASVFQHTTRLMTLVYGKAELSSLKISQTYFGQYIGRFISDEMSVDGTTGVLRSNGLSNAPLQPPGRGAAAGLHIRREVSPRPFPVGCKQAFISGTITSV